MFRLVRVTLLGGGEDSSLLAIRLFVNTAAELAFYTRCHFLF